MFRQKSDDKRQGALKKRKKFKYTLLLLVFLVWSLVLGFWSDAIAAPMIRSIQVEGNTITTYDSVLAMIASRVGGIYSREKANADVKALFESGRFSDVWVDAQNDAGGIRLVFHLVEKPIIGALEFRGNKKFKEKRLKKEVPIELYDQLSNQKLLESIDKIKELYRKKDYYLIDVKYELEPMDNGEAKLIFVINENYKSYINKVNFIGNKVFSDNQLRKVVKSKKKTILSFISNSGKLRKELLEADVALLRLHYLNHGYLRADIGAPTVEITKDKKYIYITYRIDEGKQYRIKSVQVAGDILTTPEELNASLKTVADKIYNQQTVNEDVENLTKLYGNQGYAFAMVRPIPEMDDETETVNLIFLVEKGRRIRVERIEISGNTITRDKVIRRELLINENDIYSEESVEMSKVKLMQLGYFETVDFSTPRGSQDDTLVLKIDVKEKPTGSFNIGAGFSTYDKFIFNGSISKQNFFGYGWGGTISAELSSRRQIFFGQFNDPYFLDSKWMLGLSGFRMVYRFQDFDRQSIGGSLSVGRRFFDFSSMSLGYKYEDVEVTDFAANVPALFRNNSSGQTSEISLSLSRDTRDNRLFPTKGSYNYVISEVSGSKLGGTNDYYRVSGNSRWYYPIKWGFVAKVQGRMGYIKSLNDGTVPLYERYFLGGVNSLRGYYPLSVGPTVQVPVGPAGGVSSFVYGGNKELLFNVELEVPVYEKGGFKGVVFFDAGNSYAENQNYNFKNMLLDYGFGLRWVSPMGPLRFEWGFPLNKRPGDDDVVFNFTMGSFF